MRCVFLEIGGRSWSLRMTLTQFFAQFDVRDLVYLCLGIAAWADIKKSMRK